MRIFVTGGAGYVGSACLRHLLENGHEAIAYDDLSQGHAESVPEGLLIQGGIEDEARLTAAMKDFGAEAVMHFAAATSVGESVTDPEVHYRNNICGTRTLLAALRNANVPRMLFSSTCATYGMTKECPMSEATPQAPFSPYGRTKLAVEWMIRDYAEAYGFGFTLLRYFNACGGAPDGSHGEDHDPELHLIPLVLQVPLGKRDKILVYGNDYPTEDGTCIRDYIHVDDLASAHLLAIAATNPDTREIYNIGTGTGNSVLEVLNACESVTGKSIPREIVARRPGDPPALVADPSKLVNGLGWKPKYTDIKHVVETAWAWHSSHPDGYSK